MPRDEHAATGIDEQARRLQASIADQVDKLRSSEQWARHLAFTASFHQYSLNNILLIAAQCPHATQVAGYRAWQDKGRQVRKGEHAVKIFGRSTKTIPDNRPEHQDGIESTDPDVRGETTRTLIRYPVLSVFDISQTDPIPGREDDSTPVQLLSGQDPTGILDAVTSHLHDAGWTVRREPIPGPANGYATTDGTRQIVIDSDLSPAQAAKTGLHEDAHVTMDHISKPAEYATHRGLMETEAESVAYVLAGLLGLDTADYSIGYITSWTDGDTEVIRTTAANVLHAVHAIAPLLAVRLKSGLIEVDSRPQLAPQPSVPAGRHPDRHWPPSEPVPRAGPRR